MGAPHLSRSGFPLGARMSMAAVLLMMLGPWGSAAQCSETDVSAAAVEQCVNSVRGDPAYWSQFAPCDFSGYAPAPALCSDGSLASAAQVHSDNMAARGSIGHDGFTSRVRGAGFGGARIAENVAGGQNSALEVVMSWMCSSGHAANIMDCGYQSVGTGTQCGFGGCYFTQEFGGSGACGGGCGGGGYYGYYDYDDGADSSGGGGLLGGGGVLGGRGPISRFLNFVFG